MLKRSNLPFSTTLSVIWLLAACSDPADNVPKSAVSEPQRTPIAATPQDSKEYVIIPDSKIGFVGSKVTGSHDGGFKKFSGKINVANGKVAGNSEIKIDMQSTWADNDRLTGHLKSADFFDVEKFPTAVFTITSVEPSGTRHQVTGNLNLHGVTKSVSFPADIQFAGDRVTVNAEFAINRKDFHINFPGKPNDLIRDNVVIKLNVKATPGKA